MKCSKCKSNCVKNGFQSNGNQRYICKICRRSCQQKYKNRACLPKTHNRIIELIKEGLSIRGISRYLDISKDTVTRQILKTAGDISKPAPLFGKEYEMDEMCTYIGNKNRKVWIAYAIRRDTKEVLDFRVGSRTNKTLKGVIDTLKLSLPKLIHTDKLKNYRSLIEKKIHSTKFRGTNHIERMNLSIRTHLKRLSRRTICYSKNLTMLIACLKIYFWS